MAHQQQIDFCKSVKDLHPKMFNDVDVLDIGSLDINGNNRYLFDNVGCYTGIDIGPGKNVDYVCSGHLWKHPQGRQYDVIISTECFEHDKHYAETLRNAYNLLKSGGLLMFTCAAPGRPEHGTTRTSPPDSPFTNDYYKNLSKEDIIQAFEVSGVDSIGDVFSQFFFQTRSDFPQDLYFWGIKR